jgi:GAF domain-containing protein
MLLSELAPLVNAERGTIYQMISPEGERPSLRRLASYADSFELPESIALGKGLVGQCAKENQRILLSDVPSGYMPIHSSLGASKPAAIVVLPVLFEGQTKAVIELASLHKFTEAHLSFLEQLTQSIGVVLNTIEATMRTEGLLQQSQQLTVELRAGQKELHKRIRNSSKKPGNWLNRMQRSNGRTWKSNRRAAPWRKRLPSWH